MAYVVQVTSPAAEKPQSADAVVSVTVDMTSVRTDFIRAIIYIPIVPFTVYNLGFPFTGQNILALVRPKATLSSSGIPSARYA